MYKVISFCRTFSSRLHAQCILLRPVFINLFIFHMFGTIGNVISSVVWGLDGESHLVDCFCRVDICALTTEEGWVKICRAWPLLTSVVSSNISSQVLSMAVHRFFTGICYSCWFTDAIIIVEFEMQLLHTLLCDLIWESIHGHCRTFLPIFMCDIKMLCSELESVGDTVTLTVTGGQQQTFINGDEVVEPRLLHHVSTLSWVNCI